jgi:putative transcriptional regulator
MREELFNELLESVREGGSILRGEAKGRRTVVETNESIDVAAVRRRFGLSRPKFAALLGISARTLEGWEQGRREPDGPARVLLRVAAKHPEAVLDTVAGPR